MSTGKALDIMAGEVGPALDQRCFAALKAVVANGIPQKPLIRIGDTPI
jgi:hypothetical protein